MTRDDRQTDHVPSEQLRDKIVELTDRNSELEKFNQTLTNERDRLNKNLADCSRLLKV